jgi:hypothetical protein
MRPVILGMNNPRSDDPDHALWPHPNGCTGHRLWQMLSSADPSVTIERYLLAFDRRNLLRTREWNAEAGRMVAGRLLMNAEFMGREILVLGDEVRKAFELPKEPLGVVKMYNATWWQIPHPSGLNRFYNSESNRAAVATVLKGLYDRSTYGRLLR